MKMKHAFFDFINIDLTPYIETQIMKDCLSMLITESFNPPFSEYVYNYDPKEILATRDPFKYSLAEISPFSDPSKAIDEYESRKNINMSVLNNKLSDAFTCGRITDISTTVGNGDIRWYFFQHYCETLAVFFIYPLVKLMFPHVQFKIYSSTHTFVIQKDIQEYRSYFDNHIVGYNLDTSQDFSRPLVFDINYLLQHFDVDSCLLDDSGEVVEEKDIIDWYFNLTMTRTMNEIRDSEYVSDVKHLYNEILSKLPK